MEHELKNHMVLGDLTYISVAFEEVVRKKITSLERSELKEIAPLARFFEKQSQTPPVHGPYSCYVIPLLLPSDKEAREYMKTYAREIDLMSGRNCLVIGFTKSEIKDSSSDSWGRIVNRKTHQEYCIKVSELFGIDFVQFPCLVIFENIYSTEYIVITLKSMMVEEISEVMREIFTIIKNAVSENKSPLAALGSRRKKEKFYRDGKTIISELHSIGRTLEIVVEAWMNIFFK